MTISFVQLPWRPWPDTVLASGGPFGTNWGRMVRENGKSCFPELSVITDGRLGTSYCGCSVSSTLLTPMPHGLTWDFHHLQCTLEIDLAGASYLLTRQGRDIFDTAYWSARNQWTMALWPIWYDWDTLVSLS